MKPKKYNECRVDVDWTDKKNPKPINKTLTKRASVSIHEHEAELNNYYFTRTRLFYELAEEAKEVSDVRKQADELGIKYSAQISDAKLQEKINEYLSK